MNYEIKLPLFEGPFDLLLFFIERDELDIYDIPIAKITNDFLDYMKHLEHINMEVSSEFIFVAATLMSIKAKMLLPRPEVNKEGEEIDPRDELVKHLLEYKKYKSVIQDLSDLEKNRLDKERRGNIADEIKKIASTNQVEAELQDIDLYKLLKVYEKAIAKHELEKRKPVHTVVQYPYTIEEQKKQILSMLLTQKRLNFEDIVELNREKIAVIYNFLAILELLQNRNLKIYIGEGFNTFWVSLRDEAEEEGIVEENMLM